MARSFKIAGKFKQYATIIQRTFRTTMMIIIYFHLILQFLRNCFYDNRQKNDEFYRVPAVAYFCILTFAFFLLVSHKHCS